MEILLRRAPSEWSEGKSEEMCQKLRVEAPLGQKFLPVLVPAPASVPRTASGLS